ncbi:hypothetical protein GCM10010331_44590 [Streptomyces xanthochromogenes]|uniref:hypothetical protein n=1 Tax=Streptomyces xanthochromogenes TaxID=67384 RepID=UPI001676A431|nr:hypothetical protein [Streptomyces xanthochromogenes]GHB52103.1 hypothetical protein GCM10010331_44590 [Streptomyces xanthochromogenes]
MIDLDEQLFNFVQINVPNIAPIIRKLKRPISLNEVREEYRGIQFTYGLREGSMSVSAGDGAPAQELYVYYVQDPRSGGFVEFDGI